MNFRYIIFSLTLLFCCSFIQAQVIKSEKSYLRLNITPKKEVVEISDTISPELQIISPVITGGKQYISNESEINLIGRASDESGIASVIINSEIMEISEAGVFTAGLLLEQGDNVIKVIVIDNK